MHLVPFSVVDLTLEWPLQPARDDPGIRPIWMSRGSAQPTYNFDGILKSSPRLDTESASYVQFFRNGIIEASTSRFFDATKKILYILAMEEQLIASVTSYLHFFKGLGITAPLSFALSLMNVKSFQIQFSAQMFYSHGSQAFRENDLIVPEVRLVGGSYARPFTCGHRANANCLPRDLCLDGLVCRSRAHRMG